MRVLKKVFIYILGLFLMAIGVNLSIKSQLGISPVNSLPYVVSLITGLDQGLLIIIYFSFFVLGQMVILRKEFNPLYVVQLAFISIFGYFVTLTKLLVNISEPTNYIYQFLILLVSIVSISIGVTLYISANIMPMPAEGFCLALVKITDKDFYKIVYILHTCLVAMALLLSLVFLEKLDGVREGTIIAAILIGKTMGFIEKYFSNQLKAIKTFMGK